MNQYREAWVSILASALVVMAVGVTARGQVPNHPVITEVYFDPNGVNDGPIGRDSTNPHQEFVEIYLPTCAELDTALSCSALNITFEEVEGDHTSMELGQLNYRWDLPTFCVLANSASCPVNTIPRPNSGIVVLGWVDYGDATPTTLAGTVNTRVALIKGGLTAEDGDYVFVAINGQQFGGTNNFATLAAESLIEWGAAGQLSDEVRTGQIENGSGVYLLLNRDGAGYVTLYDEKDSAHQPPTFSADPDLPGGTVLPTGVLFDAFANNDDSGFDVLLQPLNSPVDPACSTDPVKCIDLETILPNGGAFSNLVAQLPEKVTSPPDPGTANGYARVYLDQAKTTETTATNDPVSDALNAYRHVRNAGPFFPTPGFVPSTTSPPELAVAGPPAQITTILAGVSAPVEILAANVGGNSPIDMTVTSAGPSSNSSFATFSPGVAALGVSGGSIGTPSVLVSASLTAAGQSPTAPITVTATNGGAPAITNPVQTTTVTATVIEPTTGQNATGQPFQTTVFVAIQGITDAPGVTNELLQTDFGAFLAGQADITALESEGNSAILLNPATNIVDQPTILPLRKKLPVDGEECSKWLDFAGPVGKLDLGQTVAQSAEVLSGAATYDQNFVIGFDCAGVATDAVRAVRFNHPDGFAFDGTFSPSETVQFVGERGDVGKPLNGLSDATTTRTFELALIDTNVRSSANNPIESGAKDDFGLILQVRDIETPPVGQTPPVESGEFVFLSFTGGKQGADIDTLDIPPGPSVMNLIFLDLDNLHSVLGIRTIEQIIVVQAGTGTVDIVEAYTLRPVPPPTGCTVDPDCDDGLFCNGAETCDTLPIPNTCVPGTSPCTNPALPACDETTNTCVVCAFNSDCSDGLFCSGAETCDTLTNTCVAGTDPCNDGVVCTVDTCDDVLNTCTHTADDTVCDDGLFCTGLEICSLTLDCQTGTNPCTNPALPVCDEGATTCRECLVATDCDDSNDCTTDSCVGFVCGNVNVADGSPCFNNLGTCLNGVCTGIPCTVNSDCSDSNVCTKDLCIANECSNPPNMYGDVNHNDVINLFDLFCVLDGFSGVFNDCSFEDVDIEPCAGNSTLNLFDLFAVLDSFSGVDACCGP